MRMRPFGSLIAVEEARRRLTRSVTPITRTETVRVEHSLGRVSAETVRAKEPVPSFRRATWDGYAFAARSTRNASRDHPVRLTVVGEVFAEEGYDRPLGPGEAIAVATGAALPRAADTVVMFEEAGREGLSVVLHRPFTRGERLAEPGEDFPRGAVLVRREENVGAATAGALAASGRAHLEVYARPIVAVVPNGNELVSPGSRRRPGMIYESNNSALASAIEGSGGVAQVYAPVPDDEAAIEAAVRSAMASSDLVLVTGGSSVGEHDFLPAILPRVGKLLFHGIAVRPGKPTLAARAGEKVVVGMPGHPTSCLLNGYWLLLPALRRLARLPGPGWIDGVVRLDRAPVRPTAGFSTVVPLKVHGGRATPTFHDSSAITSLADANAFAIVGPGEVARRGSRVRAHLLLPPLGELSPETLLPARAGR